MTENNQKLLAWPWRRFPLYGMLHKKFRYKIGQTQKILQKIFGEKKMRPGDKTGSRYNDGNIPNVNWNDNGKLNVNGYNPDNTNGNLRSRQKFPKKKSRAFRDFC